MRADMCKVKVGQVLTWVFGCRGWRGQRSRLLPQGTESSGEKHTFSRFRVWIDIPGRVLYSVLASTFL